MRRKIAFAAMLLAILVSTLVQAVVFAWTYPDGTDDGKFEKFGSRADRLIIESYSMLPTAELAFEMAEFDILGPTPSI